MEQDSIKINEDRANRLLKKLIIIERNNIKTKQFNDAEMVKKIKKMIEEEVECY